MTATTRQTLGELGEKLVAKLPCPRCKRKRTLKRLPTNFKYADIICDFCGYLAQVKTATTKTVEVLPKVLLGAAWGPQSERMEAGIFIPLFIVLVSGGSSTGTIYYLPADLQSPKMFQKRKPLSPASKRAGSTGYMLRLDMPGSIPVRLDI